MDTEKPKDQAQDEEELEVRSEIIEGTYTIGIQDLGLTLAQLQERIEKGKIETITEKQKEYLSQLIIKGYVQEMFRFKGQDFTVGFRTLRVTGTQNALIVIRDINEELKSKKMDEGLPDSYLNNTLQVLFVSRYLSKYGDQLDMTGMPQDEFESLEKIRERYNFVNGLPGLIVDSLYGEIQRFNNAVGSAITVEAIENL